MRRIFSTILSVLLISQMLVFPAYAKPAWPSDTGIMAEGGIVIDMDSGAMIFGQNSRQAYYPASITKLLTALVVIENADLSGTVTFSRDAVYNVESGSGNPLSLDMGDQLTVEDCLYLLLLRSSNQAANALAEHVGGSRDGFVDMMNQKLVDLGCGNSHFKNPSGLNDSEQVVTPYDMALIAKAAFSNEKLFEINSALKHSIPATTNNPEGSSFAMEHKLLTTTDESSQYYFPDAKAGKTGYTSLAGNTLVTYAERDGRRLIAVVLKGTQPQYYLDSITLLDFGFNRTQNMNAAEHETAYITGDTPLTAGDKTYAPSELMIEGAGTITLPVNAAFADADKTLVMELPEGHPDTAVAMIQYTYNDRKIGQVYLCLKSGSVPVNSGDVDAQGTVTGETSPAPTASAKAEPELEPGDSQPEVTPKVSKVNIPMIIVGVALAALLGTGTAYAVIRRKKEEEAMARRRAKRRQRLQEIGCTDEEFQRLMAERTRDKKQGRG